MNDARLKALAIERLRLTHPDWHRIDLLVDHVFSASKLPRGLASDFKRHISALLRELVASEAIEQNAARVRLSTQPTKHHQEIIHAFFRRRALPGHFGCTMNAVIEELLTNDRVAAHDRRAADLLAPRIVRHWIDLNVIHEHDGLLFARLPEQACTSSDCPLADHKA